MRERITRTTVSRKDGEWIVRAYAGKKRLPAADYFTDDKADALATAKRMIERTPNHEEFSDGGTLVYGLTAPREGAKWSAPFPVPARGERVRVTFNGFGWGTVRGYFVEHGYLGVYVEPDEAPAWWDKQNADDPKMCCIAFGAEISR